MIAHTLPIIITITSLDENADGIADKMASETNNKITANLKVPFTMSGDIVEISECHSKEHNIVSNSYQKFLQNKPQKYSLNKYVPSKKILGQKKPYKNFIAKKYNFLKKSVKHQQPICKYYTICGGCKLQHLPKDDYITYKLSLLQSEIDKYALPYSTKIDFLHTLDNPYHHRRRVVFSSKDSKLGFKQYHTNNTINIEYCPLLSTNINQCLNLLAIYIKTLKVNNTETKFIITELNQKINLVIDNPILKINLTFLKNLSILTENPLFNSIYLKTTLGLEPIIIKEKPYFLVNTHKVDFPSNSFLQASVFGENLLQQLVLQYTNNSLKIADLFAGLGTFSFLFTEHQNLKILKVDAFEENATAVQNINNSQSSHISATTRDLFKNPLLSSELDLYDTIILNPPRIGATAQIKQLLHSTKVRHIIYISCNAKSFFYDLNLLQANTTLSIKNITAIDQFIFSKHTEIFCYIQKN